MAAPPLIRHRKSTELHRCGSNVYYLMADYLPPLTVRVPPKLDADLRAAAEQRGETLSQLVRRVLAESLPEPGPEEVPAA